MLSVQAIIISCNTATEDYFPMDLNFSLIGNETRTINISLIDDQSVDKDEIFYGRLMIESLYPHLVLREAVITVTIQDNGGFIMITVSTVLLCLSTRIANVWAKVTLLSRKWIPK